MKVVVYVQELKSLAKRSRQGQDNSSKPQKSGDSDSDLDSSEGSDDEVKPEKIHVNHSSMFQIYYQLHRSPTCKTQNNFAKQTLERLHKHVIFGQSLGFICDGIEACLQVQLLCYFLVEFCQGRSNCKYSSSL